MKEIGGYFGLELADSGHYFHREAMQFQSGRAALYFVLSNVKPKHIYVPFYCSDALLQPMADLKIPYTFYAVNLALEIAQPIVLGPGELLLYINYFDIKQTYVTALSRQFKDQLIVDSAQAYFTRGNGLSWFFNSARKFFGVPDGADLYTPANWSLLYNYRHLFANTIYSLEHLVTRFNGRAPEGHENFVINEALIGINYDKMSVISRCLLSHIDFKHAQRQRRDNFAFVHARLGQYNLLTISPDTAAASSHYPYLPDYFIDKRTFCREGMLIPAYWQDCIDREGADGFVFEQQLSTRLFPIPVDHRYTASDLNRIIDFLHTTNYNGFYNKI